MGQRMRLDQMVTPSALFQAASALVRLSDEKDD